MENRRLLSFSGLAVLVAAALPVSAQVAPQDRPDWAHPPVVVSHVHPNVSAGFTPAQMQAAYGFNKIVNQGQGQTIALVDAYDNPDAESDLAAFSTQFGLPECSTANGCFQLIYAGGTQPAANSGWSLEISVDIEWAHAMAPLANIVLVEASSASSTALWQAVDAAVATGASVVSMSFAGSEFFGETAVDSHFNVTGVTFCASSGDLGHGSNYPAASPYVVGVGGTALTVGPTGAWKSETAWSGSGGGLSTWEAKPAYQGTAQKATARGIPDVAYDAEPSTGVPVYSQYAYGGWVEVGGTSIGAPQWAALFAIANSSRVANGQSTLNQVQNILYANTLDFHDTKSGTNGSCGARCTAHKGYDLVTGLGSPKANTLIPALVAAP